MPDGFDHGRQTATDREIDDALEALMSVDSPPELTRRVVARIAARSDSRIARGRRRAALGVGGLVAAGLTLVVAGWLARSPGPAGRDAPAGNGTRIAPEPIASASPEPESSRIAPSTPTIDAPRAQAGALEPLALAPLPAPPSIAVAPLAVSGLDAPRLETPPLSIEPLKPPSLAG